MILNVEFGNGVISLPEKTLDILGRASELEIKLLLLICSSSALREDFSVSEAASTLAVGENDIDRAIAFLSGAGLLTVNNGEKKDITVRVKKSGGAAVTVVKSGNDTPVYTGPEIEEIFK